MATHWERLAGGDTSAFALKIAFMDDPDEGQGASEDVYRSWGAFQIWVDGWNLCAHQEEGERVESAHWYLLPLLEWFASRWNPLLHEERLSCEVADEAWKESVHRGWHRFKRQISALPKSQQNVLLATSGRSQLVSDQRMHAAAQATSPASSDFRIALSSPANSSTEQPGRFPGRFREADCTSIV